MSKIILSMLLLLLACSGLSMANECQIKEVSPKEESNNFSFLNKIEPNFIVHSPVPTSTVMHDMAILMFGNGKFIGFQKVGESFYNQSTIEKSFKKWSAMCQSEVLQFKKNGYTVLVENTHLSSDDKLNKVTVYVIRDDKEDLDYFHLLSFAGFTEKDVIQMLIKN